MAMVILLSLLELEDQTPFSLEDMPGPPPQLSTEVWKKMTMIILPSVLGVEGQTTSHCKVRHEDQAMAPASDKDSFVGSFECTPFQNRAGILFSRRSYMITSTTFY